MKKIIEKVKTKKELFIGIIIGGIVVSIIGVVGIVAANSIASDYVLYDSPTGKTNVKDAIDELYTKAENTFKTNTAQTVYASSKGLCLERNNKLNCFKPNNFDVEKEHVKQVFSDVSCYVSSLSMYCAASDFRCSIFTDGRVYCGDLSANSSCYVYSDGSVSYT